MKGIAIAMEENLDRFVEAEKMASDDIAADEREDAAAEGRCAQCCARKKERSAEEYKCLVHRLNRIEGQIRGIRKMVENDAYCVDILTQSAAVTAAMNAFNKELLAQHIRTCVAQDIRDGKDSAIDELVRTLQKLMK